MIIIKYLPKSVYSEPDCEDWSMEAAVIQSTLTPFIIIEVQSLLHMAHICHADVHTRYHLYTHMFITLQSISLWIAQGCQLVPPLSPPTLSPTPAQTRTDRTLVCPSNILRQPVFGAHLLAIFALIHKWMENKWNEDIAPNRARAIQRRIMRMVDII